MTWLVCDMDDGIWRRETTYRDGKEWFARFSDATVSQVRAYRRGPGDYELHIYENRELSAQARLMTAEIARLHGWDPEQVPLYPLADHPYERVERPETQPAG